MRYSRILASAIVVAAAASVPAAANHWWGGYRWAVTNGVLDVRVNAALTATGGWKSYVDDAVTKDWEASQVLTLGAVRAVSANPNKCTPIAGEVLVCNYAYGQRGWLGIASIWTDSNGRIAKATTKLNDTYFTMARYNTPAWKRLVTCQEVGHDFGLGHQDEGFSNANLGSCMDYTNAPAGGVVGGVNYGPSNEHPNQHDYDQLRTIYYGRADGYTTARSASSPAGSGTGTGAQGQGLGAGARDTGDEGAGDSPAEWGMAIHSDSAGRPDTFTRTLPGGRQMITHVFWAPHIRPQDIR